MDEMLHSASAPPRIVAAGLFIILQFILLQSGYLFRILPELFLNVDQKRELPHCENQFHLPKIR